MSKVSMQIVQKETSSETTMQAVVQGMQERKAENIVVLDLRKVKNAVADYFVICSGNSDTQVDALGDSVEQIVYKNTKQNPWHREGQENKEWLLLDYVDVVVHVFKKDRRTFYALEELWGDGVLTQIEN